MRWCWWKWNRNFSSLKLENWDKALVYYVFLHFFYFLLSFWIYSDSMHCCFTIFSYVYRHTKKSFLILYTKFEQKFTEKKPNEIFLLSVFFGMLNFLVFFSETIHKKNSLLFFLFAYNTQLLFSTTEKRLRRFYIHTEKNWTHSFGFRRLERRKKIKFYMNDYAWQKSPKEKKALSYQMPHVYNLFN